MTTRPESTVAALHWTTPKVIAFVHEAWQSLTWKLCLYTFLLCLTWSMVEIAGSMPDFLEEKMWGPPFNNLLSMQLNGFAVLLAILIADRGSPPPLCRWWTYFLAVVAGVLLGSTLAWIFTQQILEAPSAFPTGGQHEGFETFVFRHAAHRFVVCSLVTCAYVLRRLAAHRLTVLRGAQLDRVGVEKRVLESRLAAMQAHVDPEFLRDTLLQVERMYEFDARAADSMLNEVTKYLRAAIPQTSDPSSTVATEIRLTNAFLNIVSLQSKDRLVRIANAAALEEIARMPRMILLPLVNHAIAHRIERAQGSELLGIDTVVRNDRLVLRIIDQGTGFATDGASDAEFKNIGERLTGLYGDGAQLTLKETASGSEVELQIPYEVARDARINPAFAIVAN